MARVHVRLPGPRLCRGRECSASCVSSRPGRSPRAASAGLLAPRRPGTEAPPEPGRGLPAPPRTGLAQLGPEGRAAGQPSHDSRPRCLGQKPRPLGEGSDPGGRDLTPEVDLKQSIKGLGAGGQGATPRREEGPPSAGRDGDGGDADNPSPPRGRPVPGRGPGPHARASADMRAGAAERSWAAQQVFGGRAGSPLIGQTGWAARASFGTVPNRAGSWVRRARARPGMMS